MLVCLGVNKNPFVFVCASKGESTKTMTKVKRTREEMETTLENKKKATTNSPKIVLKKKNKVQEGGASS